MPAPPISRQPSPAYHLPVPAPRTLVTGFTAFGRFGVNPAALLASALQRPFELLEVSFAAVDDFLDRRARDDAFDRLLMLGVAADRDVIKLEQFARNHVGDSPDVRGEIRGPAPIDPAGPATLPSTLFALTPATSFAASDDAGCYLCNYAYYRALQRLPHKRIGFVHVPPLDALPLEAQHEALRRLLNAIE